MKARALMGKQRHELTHIPSMFYAELPVFYRWVSKHNHMSCLALRFLILTITRTSEVRLATFKDIEGDIWHNACLKNQNRPATPCPTLS